MKKMFMSMESLKKSNAPESFLNKGSSWRLATLLKKRLRAKFILLILRNFLSK